MTYRRCAKTRSTTSYHHGDLKKALLDAALEMLVERGEAALSLRALARLTGVSPGAPYKHYRDRSALVAAMIAIGFDRLHGRLEQADAMATEGSEVVAQAVVYVTFAQANPALFRLMFGSARTDPAAIVAADAAYAVLTERLRQIDPNDQELQGRTLAYWSLMHGLALLNLDGQIDDKGPIDKVVAHVLRFISAVCIEQHTTIHTLSIAVDFR